jgi:hypothetical protein
MRTLAVLVGAVVSFSLLGCVGVEGPPVADEPGEGVGSAASELFYFDPQPHGVTASEALCAVLVALRAEQPSVAEACAEVLAR